MSLYVGNDNIVNIHKGDDRIYRVYKGSTLLWRTYYTDEVVFESSTAGSVDLNLLTYGVYRITIIGAGGGGCGNGASGSSYSAASGAAGGGLVVDVEIPKGTLNISIGGGGVGRGGGDYQGSAGGTGGTTTVKFNGTSIGSCTGGTGGRAWFRGHYSLGQGGTFSKGSYIKTTVTSVTGSNGNGGNGNGTIYTCPVPISGINYGNGGRAMGSGSGYNYIGDSGSNGYVKVQFLGEE